MNVHTVEACFRSSSNTSSLKLSEISRVYRQTLNTPLLSHLQRLCPSSFFSSLLPSESHKILAISRCDRKSKRIWQAGRSLSLTFWGERKVETLSCPPVITSDDKKKKKPSAIVENFAVPIEGICWIDLSWEQKIWKQHITQKLHVDLHEMSIWSSSKRDFLWWRNPCCQAQL